ncbi:MAG: hypothetical protein ACJ79H_06755 [Myxococcales bacterium]
MDHRIPLYTWVRDGSAIHLARIARLRVEPGDPGQEIVDVDVRIEETLWGKSVGAARHFQLRRPVSEVARLKFPDPIWGRVHLQEGAPILLVEGAVASAKPVYVEDVAVRDAVIPSVRAVLEEEKEPLEGKERLSRYLRWLEGRNPVQQLFAAEAAAKDALPGVDEHGIVATAFAKAFASGADAFLRLSVGSWMWDRIYLRTNAQGRAEIVNATLQSAQDRDRDVAQFSLDRLAEADPESLRVEAVVPEPRVIRLLQDRLGAETSPEAAARLVAVIDALQRWPRNTKPGR